MPTDVPEIPGYRVSRLLGRGGMAEVWLAVQESLGREVALKLLLPSLARDPAMSERFLREGRIAARLDHRHIVSVYDVGIHAGQPYLAIEYLPGGPVSVDAPCEPGVALDVLRQIALALDHAHREGVVHRDIKPENILRRKDGTYALADFGIARTLDVGSSRLTQEGIAVGTPHYMSPEQLQALPLDGRADLYSLGVVLFQLLTGKLPYTGTDGVPVGMQHIHTPIPRLPESLSRYQPLIDSLLAKQADLRPQTGADLARRIDMLQGVAPAPMPTLQVATQPKRRISFRVAVAVAAVLLLMAWTGWRLRPQAESQAPEPAAVAPSPNRGTVAPTLVVLPLKVIGDEEDAGVALGLSEDLTTRLSRVAGLGLISSTSAEIAQSRQFDAAQLADRLKATHALEGSLRDSNDQLRIHLRLSALPSGRLIWTQSYDRPFAKLETLQNEVAVAIAGALDLEPDANAGGVEARDVDPAAVRRYLEVRGRIRDGLTPNWEQEVRALVAAHPDYAPAFGLLAAMLAANSDTTEETLDLIERALRIDPAEPDARIAQALIAVRQRDWAAAASAYEEALRLSPADPAYRGFYSDFLGGLGYLDEGLRQARIAQAYDPLGQIAGSNLVNLLDAQGRHAEARRHIEAALEDLPANDTLPPLMVNAHWRNAFWRRDAETATAVAASRPDSPVKAVYLSVSDTIADARRTPAAIAAIEAWERRVVAEGNPPQKNFLRLLLPETPPEERRATAEFALQTPLTPFKTVIWAPGNREFRQTPQFQAFLARTGILDYWRARGFPTQCRPAVDGAACE
jgi:TolB-like protein/tRNA A-37 threonylcarbamoyl transferase component Bud32